MCLVNEIMLFFLNASFSYPFVLAFRYVKSEEKVVFYYFDHHDYFTKPDNPLDMLA